MASPVFHNASMHLYAFSDTRPTLIRHTAYAVFMRLCRLKTNYGTVWQVLTEYDLRSVHLHIFGLTNATSDFRFSSHSRA